MQSSYHPHYFTLLEELSKFQAHCQQASQNKWDLFKILIQLMELAFLIHLLWEHQ